MRRKALMISTVLVALATTTGGMAQERKSFEEFRRGLLNSYNDFRQTILDHYADFLNGEWHEYESLNGERRDRTPKPSVVPSVEKPSAPPALPKRSNPGAEAPSPVIKPERPGHPASDTPLPKSKETTPEGGLSKGRETAPVASPSRGEDTFSFYDLPMTLPAIDFNIAYRLSTSSDYAAQWKDLDREGVAKKLVPAIKKKVEDTGLNDYLTYEYISSYIDSKFPQADPSSRLSAVHYLLANLGYDARIAMTGSGSPLLLLPFKQTIYARNYIMMPEGKYYVFAPEGFDYSRLGKEGIKTCTLPRDAASGDKFDLVLGRLNLPVKPKAFNLEYGPLKLTGEVNENLMPILYRYPQMPIGDYAVSSPDPELRARLVEQVKSQLGSMEGDKAVEELLGFMHNVFEYATDEEFHGFEKPYFLEETLYYPKNDCEDRAIFYTYFLWNSLGKEAQLISFPGHEAATVCLDNPVEGTFYTQKGKKYYISDPTFIGSHTGMVMPIYSNRDPKIDYTFGKSK